MSDEWELSKENVQPLKSGRRFDDLTAALQPQQASAVMEEKRQFETELRTYCGPDPLDVWDRYIAWTEQHHPSGGKDSHLLELLERCVAEFKDDQKYKNDPRYVDVWLKFVNRCKDCMEIYTFMSAQGIGSQVAALYEAWAWDLERVGNHKKADKVYQQGIAAGAQPLDHLRKSHSEFQARVARKMMSGELEASSGTDSVTSSQRAALGDLRGQGIHHSAGSSRVGSARQSSKGGITASRAPLQNNNAGGGFAIFTDDAAAQGAPAAAKQSLVTQGRNKENQKTPGVWTDARVKQKSVGTVPISAAAQNEPEFRVHQDEGTDQPMVTPRKAMPQMSTALSVKKEKADPFARVQQQSAAAAVESLPMYNKHQVYKGTSEMSFEELRAASWKAKQKNIQEKKQMEDKLLAMQSELQQVKEMCANLMIQKQQPAATAAPSLPVEQVQPATVAASVPRHGIPWPVPQIRVQNSYHEGSQPSQPVAQHLFPSALHQQPAQLPFPIHSDQSLNSTRTPSMNASSFSGPNLSSGGSVRSQPLSGDPTPDSSTCSFRNTSRGRLCAPSPTVNTREARANMQGLFNETLNIQDHFGLPAADGMEDEHEDEFAATIDVKRQSVAAPFAIFSDQEEKAKPAAMGGFQIFCDPDQENIKPKSKYDISDDQHDMFHGEDMPEEPKRKCLSSILRRSTIGRKSEAFGDEDEIVGSQKDEPMDQLEFMGDDMTFMPGVESTRKFSEAARYASTPFNPVGVQSLPAPPVSSIKPVGDQGLGRIQDGTFACPTGLPPHCQADAKGRLNSTGCSYLSKTSQEHSQASVSQPQNFTVSNVTTAQQTANSHDLSPILEASDEDAKSTSHTTQNSHASTASGPGSVYRSHTAGSTSSQPKTPEAPVLSLTNIKVPPSQPKLNSDLSKMEPHAEEMPAISADQTFHEIDMSNYCPPEPDDKTERLLGMSILIDPSDPFSKETIANFLSRLSKPISSYPGYYRCRGKLPKFEIGGIFQFDDNDEMYSNVELIGKGGYASVYRVSEIGSETAESVMKVQKPSHEWEFYIVSELHKRLSQSLCEVDVEPSVMKIHKAYFYDDGSCFFSDFRGSGTLLDLVNRCRHDGKVGVPEALAMFITIELLQTIEQIHKCKIIHGDLKPDNFLLRNFPHVSSPEELRSVMTSTHSIELIDFGRSIDMTMYPEGTTFMAKVATKDFQCIEMRANQPWTYQTDLFGLAGTVHVILLGSYMNVYQVAGYWKTTSSFRRTFKHHDLWQKFFALMLNIPSCDELPDLTQIRRQLEQRFFSNMAVEYVTNYTKWHQLCYK